MKTLFLECRKNINLSDIDFSKLDLFKGKKISLAGSVQYLDLIKPVKDYLESISCIVKIRKGSYHKGQVLGCNSSAFDINSDYLLMLNDGTFHAINNAIQLQREIYVFNGKEISKIKKEEIEAENKRILAKKKKFLSSKRIGLIVSSKKGQATKNANLIAKRIEEKGKKVYIFECDNINYNEFENFPSINLWVNTACFGISQDSPLIINLSDILEYI